MFYTFGRVLTKLKFKIKKQKNMNRTITILLFITLQISAQCWLNINARYSHSLAVKNDGTLWACGSNTNEHFGKASPTSSNVFVQFDADTNWKEASASQYFSYAIKTNPTFWSKGRNEEGQLGNGTNGSTNDGATFSSDKEITAVSIYNLLG